MKNRKRMSGSFSIIGDVRAVAGVTVSMADFGKYSAVYVIDTSTHPCREAATQQAGRFPLRADREYRQNATNKRGIVVDRDPKKMRVKVQFEDEDETVSYWIDVLAKSSTGASSFEIPGRGDEVWCAMDAKGEAGCIIGSRYNNKDAPPFQAMMT